jgi:hypothetical protein
MKSIEESTPPVEVICRTLPNRAGETTPPTIDLVPPNQGCAWSLDGLPAEMYQMWEAKVIREHKQAKTKMKISSASTTPSTEAPASKKNDNATSSSKSHVIGVSRTASMHAEPTPQATRITAGTSLEGDSSITPSMHVHQEERSKLLQHCNPRMLRLHQGECRSNAASLSARYTMLSVCTQEGPLGRRAAMYS